MTDELPLPDDPNDEPDLGATYVLTPDGWELSDYLAPGAGWRVTPDGAYESPDGQTRTWARADPTGEWSDVAGEGR